MKFTKNPNLLLKIDVWRPSWTFERLKFSKNISKICAEANYIDICQLQAIFRHQSCNTNAL